MKGGEHKYGFNSNKREKSENVRVVDDETGDKHELSIGACRPRIFFINGFLCFLEDKWQRNGEGRERGDEKMSLEEAHHHRRPWIRAWRKKEMNEGRGREEHEILCSKRALKSEINGSGMEKEEREETPLQGEDESRRSSPPIMASPPASPPPPPPSPLAAPTDASASPSIVKQTRKASCLRSLSTRPPGAERPVVHVDPATGKADGPHRKKLRTYLGIVARDKVDVTYDHWKEVPTAQKDLIWEDIQAEFEIPEASDRFVQKGTGHPEAEHCPHVLSHGGYDYLEQKLLAEKTKKKLEEVAQSGSVDGVIDPPSPVRRHVKWKMARTKKTGEMAIEAAKEIAEKIVSHFQLNVTRQLMASFSQMQSQMQSQGLALPPEPLVGPSDPRISTKGSCVDPSGNDPETGDSDRCGLYIEADPTRLVALGRVYEGSIVVYNTPLLLGQVKVGVEEVTNADAPVPVPTDEVSLVGQALHTFLAWPTHLVKSLSQQVAVSPAKPPPKPDPEVDDLLYLMTLTIPELFLRPYQVTWDAIVFRVFNLDFPLYIKHEDLSEIAHGGQCLSISVLQLWIFYIKTLMQSSKHDVYLGAYLNGPDNYLKGIINSALKGLDDASQPKSKAPARWIVVKYFNDPRALEPERLKALRIQWAQYYLRVRDQT
ncbi:hypothetical protein HKD37_10G028109 [Glycine soja]